jgi:ketosteroid isomerase-like protein
VIVASQNVEIAKKAYDAFAAGDLDMVLSTFDDNVEFVVPGNSTVSGTYRGKAEVTNFSRS